LHGFRDWRAGSKWDAGRIYVTDASQAPPGVKLNPGPRGGMWYAPVQGKAGQVEAAPKPPKAAPKGKAPPKPRAEKRATGEPFTGADDPNLPQRVQAESDAIRGSWVGAFNDSLKAGGSEADALAAANAKIPKRSATPAKPAKATPRQVGEPFKGSADPSVPRRIQAESPAVRDKWVSTFNAGVARGSEADAIAAANRTLPDRRQPPAPKPGKKELRPVTLTLDCDHQIGEKCGMCEPAVMGAMAVDHYAPFGGATSFEEIDRWLAANKVRQDVDALSDAFEALTRNIWADDMMSMADKASAIQAAAAMLKTRLGSPVEDADALDEEGDEADKALSPLGRLRGLFSGEKAAPTKSEAGGTFRASDYADIGDEAKPSTWKLRMAEGKSGNFTLAQIARAITAMQPGGFRGQQVSLGSSKPAVTARIAGAMEKAKGDPMAMANLRKRLGAVKELEWGTSPAGSFRTFKDAGGAWRWAAVYSNRFEDSEGETFSEESHREFEAYVDRTGDMPELRLWHVPGSRLGIADIVTYDDRGFMLAAGTYDGGKEVAAQALAAEGPLAVSHGYLWRPADKSGGVFGRYRTFEISPLPRAAAANQLTGFEAGGGDDMGMPVKKREFLTRVLGAESVKALEANLGTLAEKAAAEGIAFKDLADLFEVTPVVVATKEADPPAPTATAASPDLRALLLEAMAPVTTSITELRTALEGQAVQIKALKETDDAKIAALITPRAHPTAPASESNDTALRKNSKEVADAVQTAAGAIPPVLDYYARTMGVAPVAEQPFATPVGAQA
jgi:hypothetical protein